MWVAAEWPPRTPAARLSVSFRTRVRVSKTSHSVQNLSPECGGFFNRLLEGRSGILKNVSRDRPRRAYLARTGKLLDPSKPYVDQGVELNDVIVITDEEVESI